MQNVRDLTLFKGEYFNEKFRWKLDGSFPDLRTATGQMLVRPANGSADVVADISTANSRMVLGDGGLISLILGSAYTANLALGSHVYDVKVTISGVSYFPVGGAFLIQWPVTR